MSAVASEIFWWRRRDLRTRAIELVAEDGATRRIIEKNFGDLETARKTVTAKNPVRTAYSHWWPDRPAMDEA